MSKSKVEIVSTDYLNSETLADIEVLYDRVRHQNGGLDPTMYSPDELIVFNKAVEGGALSHPTFYSEDNSPSLLNEPNTMHYLAIENSGRKSERIVGHSVLQLANPDYAGIWGDGVRTLEPRLKQREPRILELGGAVVDPDRQGRGIWSGMVERRVHDVSIQLGVGGHAVAAVNQYHTEEMSKMSEFGGVVVGRTEEESDSPMNLIVFPKIYQAALKYISPERTNAPDVNLSSITLASEVDSSRRFEFPFAGQYS